MTISRTKLFHQAIYSLGIALKATNLRMKKMPKVRIVFSDRDDYACATRSLMEEIDPIDSINQKPPKFQICGIDVALLIEDR